MEDILVGASIMNLEFIHIIFDIVRVGELFEEIKIQNLKYCYPKRLERKVLARIIE